MFHKELLANAKKIEQKQKIEDLKKSVEGSENKELIETLSQLIKKAKHYDEVLTHLVGNEINNIVGDNEALAILHEGRQKGKEFIQEFRKKYKPVFDETDDETEIHTPDEDNKNPLSCWPS